MKRGTLGDDLFLTGVTAMWAFNFVLTKVGLRELDVLALILVRNITTVVFLVLLFLAMERRWPRRPGSVRRLLLLGLVGVTLNQITYNGALRFTSATNASLLSATTPIFGLILAKVLENERTSGKRWLGAAIGLAGVALIVGGGKGTFTFGGEAVIGDLMMLAACAALALFTVIGKPLLKVCTPVEVTLFGYLIGVPLLIPISAGAVLSQDWAAVSWVGWAAALAVGINFSTTNVLFYRQVGRVGAGRAMVFMYLVPVFGTLLAIIFLQESLSIWQAVGAVVALVGVNTARTG